MTRQKYGILAGILGAAFSTWYMRRQDYVARKMSEAGSEARARHSPATAP